MNYIEEQNNELEALEAIYPNELNVISRKPIAKFSISVKSEESAEELPTDQSMDSYELQLVFTFVTSYPDEPPIIEIQDSTNLDDCDEEELLQLLEVESKNSLGMVMIFTLVSVAIEWINQKCDQKRKEIKESQERKLKEAEELEMKKFEGTRVNVDSFLVWRNKFEAEMNLLNGSQRTNKLEVNKRLTGRELFERDKTLIESDLKFLDEVAEENFDGVAIDESLFQDLDELDLDNNER